ncbi:MAG: hypothetical protein KME21_31970 [Desmonostoc vinosum HA7617-LM4]|nr:hypothetical protein [Desmonostoc vinosum HA7617-LM4]
MPYTKETLQNVYSLSLDEVDATFRACGLPTDQDEYSDEDIEIKFDVLRGYLSSGRVTDYEQAKQLFQEAPSIEPVTFEPFELKNISELLSMARSDVGVKISLTEALQILQACGLTDKDEYSPIECDRFLKACDLIKQQGQTKEQVAAHFGIRQQPSYTEAMVDLVGESASLTEDQLVDLVDSVTQKRAENIPGLVNQIYLKNVVQVLAEHKEELTFCTLAFHCLNSLQSDKSDWYLSSEKHIQPLKHQKALNNLHD